MLPNSLDCLDRRLSCNKHTAGTASTIDVQNRMSNFPPNNGSWRSTFARIRQMLMNQLP
ncbi:hypothetical protein Mal52_42070 [Symmachiella dynata]|uniref:Uncharacterized protein n=1 Tax=Symmachiella dynata TaxID=2527995 RepID=A0A517ZT94_9PLAN|nr:hypothetical protein Mal52_42070 [Symmachiella dynata]